MGVPRQHRWQVATVGPEKFKKDMQKTMKSLVKNLGAQLYTQDDITSLSLNPHFARPTSSGVAQDQLSANRMAGGEQSKQFEDDSSRALKALQEMLRRKISGEENVSFLAQNTSASSLQGENWGRYPSSLLCDICRDLMHDAYLTPCC